MNDAGNSWHVFIDGANYTVITSQNVSTYFVRTSLIRLRKYALLFHTATRTPHTAHARTQRMYLYLRKPAKVASNLSLGSHTATLVRASEAFLGTVPHMRQCIAKCFRPTPMHCNITERRRCIPHDGFDQTLG